MKKLHSVHKNQKCNKQSTHTNDFEAIIIRKLLKWQVVFRKYPDPALTVMTVAPPAPGPSQDWQNIQFWHNQGLSKKKIYTKGANKYG